MVRRTSTLQQRHVVCFRNHIPRPHEYLLPRDCPHRSDSQLRQSTPNSSEASRIGNHRTRVVQSCQDWRCRGDRRHARPLLHLLVI